MSSIFGVLINGELQAVHESKKVINNYMMLYNNSNPDDHLALISMKKSSVKKIKNLNDIYLVKCMGIYIQSKYEDVYTVMNYDRDEIKKNIKNLKQMIYKSEHLTKKKMLILVDTINRLEKVYDDINTYIPSIRLLDEEYWKMEEYKNKIGG